MAATVIPICWVEATGARVTGLRTGDVVECLPGLDRSRSQRVGVQLELVLLVVSGLNSFGRHRQRDRPVSSSSRANAIVSAVASA
jgi:hypothetical protein